MKLKYKFTIQQVTDFWAAVPVEEDASRYRGVISLNETSKDMMELLANDITLEVLLSTIQKMYNVAPERLRADVEVFLQQLRDEDILLP